MAHNRLTVRGVEAKLARGRYSDGDGLVLQVSRWGTKAWVFRYQRDGVERHMGLGPVHTFSLVEARELARECRQLVKQGSDPIEMRKAKRQAALLEATRSVTFQVCAEKYVTDHKAGWRNEKHRAQWSSTLETYAYPIIGALSVASVDTALVLKCLEPIWKAKPETGKRLRGRIESILDSAAARGYRSGENPARWRGHLDQLLPAPGKVRAVVHHPAMPWADLPGFMGELRTREETAARALELTVLTALRTGEVIGARWGEFELAQKVWTIPSARMKATRDHRVPLSRRALEILAAVARDGDYVFAGRQPGEPLSNMAMLKTLERMARDDVTVHGFRSTFRDWAAESTNYPNHVVEMALAHVVGDKVEAAYRRGDLFEKRRRLMEEWARYCNRPAAATGQRRSALAENVVRIHGA